MWVLGGRGPQSFTPPDDCIRSALCRQVVGNSRLQPRSTHSPPSKVESARISRRRRGGMLRRLAPPTLTLPLALGGEVLLRA